MSDPILVSVLRSWLDVLTDGAGGPAPITFSISDVARLRDALGQAIARLGDQPTAAPCKHDDVAIIAGTQCVDCGQTWISTRRKMPSATDQTPAGPTK